MKMHISKNQGREEEYGNFIKFEEYVLQMMQTSQQFCGIVLQ